MPLSRPSFGEAAARSRSRRPRASLCSGVHAFSSRWRRSSEEGREERVRLGQLFSGVDARLPPEADRVDVRSLAVDSRQVVPGSLFAALRGTETDGARYVPQAVERGAVAVLCDRPIEAGSVGPAALVLATE